MISVSIIVPCYNEERTIHLLLEALVEQDYPLEEMEVIIADGLSTDQTRDEIDRFRNNHSKLSVKVIDNEKRTIPAGLNKAISNATGNFIIRLDAHSMPERDYISNCVKDLTDGLGENVGGIWMIRASGTNIWARSIAVAASHRLGVGDASYRYAEKSGYVDTVPFGAFKRNLIKEIGPFDETLLTNEDYEFNARIRKNGGKIWLDPSIRSTYFARSTIAELAQQYWRYGYWKARMLRRYPRTLRWRQLLPPAFVLSLILFGILALVIPLTKWIIILELTIYILALVIAGIKTALAKGDIGLLIGVPVAIATMHITWGSAFLWSMLQQLVAGRNNG
jgi:glycosyltransferase involved in cell wall biosynthesis